MLQTPRTENGVQRTEEPWSHIEWRRRTILPSDWLTVDSSARDSRGNSDWQWDLASDIDGLGCGWGWGCATPPSCLPRQQRGRCSCHIKINGRSDWQLKQNKVWHLIADELPMEMGDASPNDWEGTEREFASESYQQFSIDLCVFYWPEKGEKSL